MLVKIEVEHLWKSLYENLSRIFVKKAQKIGFFGKIKQQQNEFWKIGNMKSKAINLKEDLILQFLIMKKINFI
jgi:hypothetical protein